MQIDHRCCAVSVSCSEWVFVLVALMSVLFTLVFADSALAQVIDLRDGARTRFYGNKFSGSPDTGDFYGWAIAFGDVDGDGYQDFLASSANADGPFDAHGPERDTYLFFGRPRSEVDSLYAVDEPGVADIVFYRAGFAMTCADIDADGYDDIVLSEGSVPAAGVFIVFGRPRAEFRRVYNFKSDRPDYTAPDILVPGSGIGGAFNVGGREDMASRSLESGDINGDGYSDIAMGCVGASGPSGGRVVGGATYVVFGRPRGEFTSLIDVDFSSSLPHPDVVIYGANRGDAYPTTLAIADLDGDGIDDLVTSSVRSWGRDNVNLVSGEVIGFWGKREWRTVYDLQNEEFDFSISGIRGKAAFGYWMEMGDLDGDGRDDLVVGQPFRTIPLPDDRRWMGEYRIYFGRPRVMWPRWSEATEFADILIVGASGGDVFSSGNLSRTYAMSAATGDRDGDGYDDLLIGAGYADGPDELRRAAGEAYLLRGRPRGEWSAFIDLGDGYDIIMYGVDSPPSPGFQFDLFGFMTAMGDFDGDGLDEMFISAPHADGPNNSIGDAGEIYVIYSDATRLAGEIPTGRPTFRAELMPNYPNPFNPTTTFHFRAPPGDVVTLTVYDALGREVARPLSPERMGSEERVVRWEALDSQGRPLPSGVYFVKLRAGPEAHAQKVLLVR